MKRLCCLLLLLLFQLSLYAGQERYEVDTAFFHDDQQTHTLESIQAQAFQPYRGQLRLGFTRGETWIRIQLKDLPASAAPDPGLSLVLRVDPYTLDKLDFYQQTFGNWTHQLGGELQLEKKNICIELQHCFEFNASNARNQFAYLKVQTTGVRIVRMDVMAPDQVFESSIGVIKSVNTALNLSVALLVLSVTFLFFERSRLLLVFCGFQTTVVLSICAFSGALQEWWGVMLEVQPNTMTSLALVMRMAMTVLLAWAVVSDYKPSSTYHKWVAAVLMACGFNLLLVLSGYETEAGLVNYGLGFLIPYIQIWGARTVSTPMSGRWIFTAGWLVFLLFIVLGFPYSFGYEDWRDQFKLVQTSGDLRLNGIPIGIVIFWLVATEKASRNRKKFLELQALKIQAAESKAHEDGLKERRDLIDMLTHELKTPLSTIKFAMASLKRTVLVQGESSDRMMHINASVERMDAMIEHVALSNKIERMEALGTEETVSALELMNVVMQEYREPERFELDIQDGVVFRAAPHFLALIIENLVSNAVKYAQDGKVRISIQDEASNMTCFRISNRVADDHHPDEARLFERYYRHPSFQDSPGMGIGLSLVNSAAQKMGAHVHYQKIDQDVVFEVRFPR
ncbi:ATP-binding protein [Limnohabitans sp. Rim8]|uniref:sensor histidine kinase n=1 Tax=Limnohabitans sp. Rim8 TaxID=1100718 RepID=UPI0026070F7C|nr:ATP-binding protein [Limnohabitans sp. Rim8]